MLACLGPLIAIPRTCAVSFEMFNFNNLIIFSIIYFILVFLIELFLVSPDVADKVFPWNLRTVNGYLKSVFIYVPLVSVGYGIFLVFEGVI